jgi:ribonuclease-3
VTAAASWARDRLGHEFADSGLLELALTHRSASGRNNERLEFLGDAVLGLVIARALYERRPTASEGLLTRLRARLVRGETLAELAGALDFAAHMRLGSGELRTGGFQRSSTLANVLEATIGAIYLDGGMVAAEGVVRRVYAALLDNLPAEEELTDAKTRLQELLQARGLRPPVYTVNSVAGAAHAQFFEVTCRIDALGVLAGGHGSSRRLAEQDAAARALASLAGPAGAGGHAADG